MPPKGRTTFTEGSLVHPIGGTPVALEQRGVLGVYSQMPIQKEPCPKLFVRDLDGTLYHREMITETELRFVKARGKLYPDVKETLARLLDHGHFLTLCTNAGEAYTDAVLNTCGIANPFDAVCFRRTSEDIKTEMAAKLTNRARHSRAYVIGDRYHDLLAGRRAGCTVIASSYDYARPGELPSCGPYHLFLCRPPRLSLEASRRATLCNQTASFAIIASVLFSC